MSEAVALDDRQLRFDREPLGSVLSAGGFRLGDAAHIRIFKAERVLELWLRALEKPVFRLFCTHPIAGMSGDLGPKLAEGDRQAPEGFYAVGPKQLNPQSLHHLAFNLGYPNAYDRQLGRTGSYLMVHGGTQSAGCFAMTDRGVDQIYAVVDAALRAGQVEVQVAVFPFRMTEDALARQSSAPWLSFWENLREGAHCFERDGIPPAVAVRDGRYVFGPDIAGAELIVGSA
jgi:murein L,D-transpeptidase YafK